jgi:Flp pilus assembly pilin Flp
LQKTRSIAQSITEYAIILALVVVVLILVLSVTGVSVQKVFCSVLRGLGGSGAGCNSTYCQDNFSDMSNWTDKTGWEVRNGQLCNIQSKNNGTLPNVNSCSQTRDLPSDYEITVDYANLIAGSNAGYGIFFRTQSTNPLNGYIFQFDPGLGNAFLFRKWVNGAELGAMQPIYYPPSSFVFLNTPHQIKISAKGSLLKAYVDNQLVLSVTDSTYASGGTGLRVWGSSTSVCFDNLAINPLP